MFGRVIRTAPGLAAGAGKLPGTNSIQRGFPDSVPSGVPVIFIHPKDTHGQLIELMQEPARA